MKCLVSYSTIVAIILFVLAIYTFMQVYRYTAPKYSKVNNTETLIIVIKNGQF